MSSDEAFDGESAPDGAAAGGTPVCGGVASGDDRGGERLGGDPDRPADAGDLAQLVVDARAADRHVAAAVLRAGRLVGSGVAEAEAGMPVEQVLLTACRLTGADRHTLVTASDVLADMPTLRELFATGGMSWGQVRGICAHARSLSRADREWLDTRLAATIAQRDGLDCFDPDELVDAAGDAVAELRDAHRRERDERHELERSFLALQPDFVGGVRAYGELDAQIAAPLLAALQAASPLPHAGQAHHRRHAGDGGDAHGGHVDDAQDERAGGAARSGWSGPSRSRQHAQGLFQIASEWLAGHSVGGDGTAIGDAAAGATVGSMTARAARPQLIVHVTLAEAKRVLAGHVDLAARGPLPRLTAAAVEALSCSGDVQAVVFDGAQPLATTRKTHAAAISESTRQAVEARDLKCRWPGCPAPLAHTEIHHLVPVREGGTHDPGNLVCLCRVHHLQAHGLGWALAVDRDTGAVTGWRAGRKRWSTLPPTTQLARAPGESGGGGNGDPHPGAGGSSSAGGQPDGRDPPDAFLDHHGNPLPF